MGLKGAHEHDDHLIYPYGLLGRYARKNALYEGALLNGWVLGDPHYDLLSVASAQCAAQAALMIYHAEYLGRYLEFRKVGKVLVRSPVIKLDGKYNPALEHPPPCDLGMIQKQLSARVCIIGSLDKGHILGH